MNTRRFAFSALTGLGLAASLFAASTAVQAADTKPQLMFVQSATAMKSDAQTLRLVDVAPQTIYFSDRPIRLAGHITLQDYMKEWTAAAGPNNFSKDPPNATLSVYEAGKAENALIVVEISQPKIEGKDLVYRYKLLEGKMPASGGASAIFIDWIGPGGGVGPGFHGVGVGRRGVGVR